MKQLKNKQLLLTIGLGIVLLLLNISLFAQTLTIKGKVLFNDKQTLEQFKISIIDMDTAENYNTITTTSIKDFKCNLDFNRDYMIIISKEGYQTKAIAVSTYCKLNKPFKYNFYVNLINTEPIIENPQFVGGIYYNKKKQNFDYYLKTYTLK